LNVQELLKATCQRIAARRTRTIGGPTRDRSLTWVTGETFRLCIVINLEIVLLSTVLLNLHGNWRLLVTLVSRLGRAP